jgi:hypothetical protein
MSILNQGVGTCFNRISQTFTAVMIKDMQSPYLNRSFLGLSDECLGETIKGINPFKKNVGKGYQALNQLISEVFWFHEKVLKIQAPVAAGQASAALGPVSDRFSKMENFKLNLMDEIESASAQLRQVQINDEYLMGTGLIIFVLALGLLSLQEFNRVQLRKSIERDALNYLATGKHTVGAMVDQIVNRALMTQGMPVTAQIFRDYHGDVLERMVSKMPSKERIEVLPEIPKTESESSVIDNSYRTSFKEVLVSIQNIQSKESLQATDVRDVQLDVPLESFEQMMNAAVSQLVSRRTDTKRIMISNQIHSDKVIVNLFLAGATFHASELEFADGNAVAEGIDMNLIILKEMVQEAGSLWHLENKADRNGNITGMNIRFVVNRSPKESKSKNLISVMKGKKKDLTKDLMN